MSTVKIIECPRDAMQGIKEWIPSEDKLSYIQSILSVGFDVIDFGSFVSPTILGSLESLNINLISSRLGI